MRKLRELVINSIDYSKVNLQNIPNLFSVIEILYQSWLWANVRDNNNSDTMLDRISILSKRLLNLYCEDYRKAEQEEMRRESLLAIQSLFNKLGHIPLYFRKKIDFSGLNFSKIDLIGLDLNGYNFKNSNFNECNLSGSSLRLSHETQELNGARLDLTILPLNMNKAPAFDNSFIDAKDIQNFAPAPNVFNRVNFSNYDYYQFDLRGAIFDQCYFLFGCWSSPLLNGAVFTNCRIYNWSFSGGNFHNCKFINCSFENVNFSASYMENCVFKDCTFDGVMLLIEDLPYGIRVKQVDTKAFETAVNLEKRNEIIVIRTIKQFIEYLCDIKPEDKKLFPFRLLDITNLITNSSKKYEFDFQELTIFNVDFSLVAHSDIGIFFIFDKAVMKNCRVIDTAYFCCSLQNTKLENCDFINVSFRSKSANSTQYREERDPVNFEGLDASNCNFSQSDMKINAMNSTWRKVCFYGANISGSNFTTAIVDLEQINLNKCNFNNTVGLVITDEHRLNSDSISTIKFKISKNIHIEVDELIFAIKNNIFPLNGLNLGQYSVDELMQVRTEFSEKKIKCSYSWKNDYFRNVVFSKESYMVLSQLFTRKIRPISLSYTDLRLVFDSQEVASKRIKKQKIDVVDLSKVEMVGANCQGVIVRNCNLSGANAQQADFSHADFNGVKEEHLLGCNFLHAKFHNTKFGNDKEEEIRVALLLLSKTKNFPWDAFSGQLRIELVKKRPEFLGSTLHFQNSNNNNNNNNGEMNDDEASVFLGFRS